VPVFSVVVVVANRVVVVGVCLHVFVVVVVLVVVVVVVVYAMSEISLDLPIKYLCLHRKSFYLQFCQRFF